MWSNSISGVAGLVSALAAHGTTNVDLANSGLWAVSHLASTADNQRLLGEAGVAVGTCKASSTWFVLCSEAIGWVWMITEKPNLVLSVLVLRFERV